MKRIIITGAVLLGTVSASLGLLANASFAQSAPSVVQSHNTVLDDRGGLSTHAEPGDDNSSHQSGSDDGPGHS
jgi:hypothetical protein